MAFYCQTIYLLIIPYQNLSIDTDLHAANGKKVKALDIFAYALAFFKEQALKVNQIVLSVCVQSFFIMLVFVLLCALIGWLQELSDQAGAEFDNVDVRWVITVPAIWKMPAKQFMREAAYKVPICTCA